MISVKKHSALPFIWCGKRKQGKFSLFRAFSPDKENLLFLPRAVQRAYIYLPSDTARGENNKGGLLQASQTQHTKFSLNRAAGPVTAPLKGSGEKFCAAAGFLSEGKALCQKGKGLLRRVPSEQSAKEGRGKKGLLPLLLKAGEESQHKTIFPRAGESFASITPIKQYTGKFFNQCFDKGRLKNFVLWFLLNYGEHKTVSLVEQLKNVGFEYASRAGISLGIDDLKIPPKKSNLIYDAENQTNFTVNQYIRGEITGVERFQRLIDTWHRTSEVLKQEVIDYFEATDILNPVYMMAFSGARGNISQVRQLVGMRGLMADPQGQIIDFPIRSNFREGLTLTEYIISSYGARKGIVDTALRTANAGYLTRRLVDVAQHIIISNFDCGTNRGIFLTNMKEGNKTIHSLSQRIVGRILARDLFIGLSTVNPSSKNCYPYRDKEGKQEREEQVPSPPPYKYMEEGKLTQKTQVKVARSPLRSNQRGPSEQSGGEGSFSAPRLRFPYGSAVREGARSTGASRNEEVTLDLAFEIGKKFDKVFVRSPLTCEKLICQLCYGWSLAQGSMVSIGEAVGVVAAQSIGEPGTQLTMRTFHTGGVFSGDVSDQIKAPFDGVIQYISAIPGTLIRTPEGKIAFLTKSEGSFLVKKISSGGGVETKKFTVPHYTLLYIRNGQNVYEKEVIAQISSISQKTNATDDAELTIKSEIEGQFYSKFLGFREKIVGCSLRSASSVIDASQFPEKKKKGKQKFPALLRLRTPVRVAEGLRAPIRGAEEGKLLPPLSKGDPKEEKGSTPPLFGGKNLPFPLGGKEQFRNLEWLGSDLKGSNALSPMYLYGGKRELPFALNAGKQEKIYEAWAWGYAWILSGKIYDYKNSCSFQTATPSLPIIGDLLNTKSHMTQTKWSLSNSNGSSISFYYSKRTPSMLSINEQKAKQNKINTVGALKSFPSLSFRREVPPLFKQNRTSTASPMLYGGESYVHHPDHSRASLCENRKVKGTSLQTKDRSSKQPSRTALPSRTGGEHRKTIPSQTTQILFIDLNNILFKKYGYALEVSQKTQFMDKSFASAPYSSHPQNSLQGYAYFPGKKETRGKKENPLRLLSNPLELGKQSSRTGKQLLPNNNDFLFFGTGITPFYKKEFLAKLALPQRGEGKKSLPFSSKNTEGSALSRFSAFPPVLRSRTGGADGVQNKNSYTAKKNQIEKLPYIVQWFPNKYKTESGGFIIFENSIFSKKSPFFEISSLGEEKNFDSQLQLKPTSISLPENLELCSSSKKALKKGAAYAVLESHQAPYPHSILTTTTTNKRNIERTYTINRNLLLKTREINNSKILLIPSDVFKISTVDIMPHSLTTELKGVMAFLSPKREWEELRNPGLIQTTYEGALREGGGSLQETNINESIKNKVYYKNSIISNNSKSFMSIFLNKKINFLQKNRQGCLNISSFDFLLPTLNTGSDKLINKNKVDNNSFKSSILLKIKKSIIKGEGNKEKQQGLLKSGSLPYSKSSFTFASAALCQREQSSLCRSFQRGEVPLTKSVTLFPARGSYGNIKIKNFTSFCKTICSFVDSGKKSKLNQFSLLFPTLKKIPPVREGNKRVLLFLNSIYMFPPLEEMLLLQKGEIKKTITVSNYLERFYKKFNIIKNKLKFYSFVLMQPYIYFKNQFSLAPLSKRAPNYNYGSKSKSFSIAEGVAEVPFGVSVGVSKSYGGTTPMQQKDSTLRSSTPCVAERGVAELEGPEGGPPYPATPKGCLLRERNKTEKQSILQSRGYNDNLKPPSLLEDNIKFKPFYSLKEKQPGMSPKNKETRGEQGEIVFHATAKKGWVFVTDTPFLNIESKLSHKNFTARGKFSKYSSSAKQLKECVPILKGKKKAKKSSFLTIHKKLIYAGQPVFPEGEILFNTSVFAECFLLKNIFNIKNISSFSKIVFLPSAPPPVLRSRTGSTEGTRSTRGKEIAHSSPLLPYTSVKGYGGRVNQEVTRVLGKEGSFGTPQPSTPYKREGDFVENENKDYNHNNSLPRAVKWITNKKSRYAMNNLDKNSFAFSMQQKEAGNSHRAPSTFTSAFESSDISIKNEKNLGVTAYLFQPIKEFEQMNNFEIKKYTYESTINAFNNSYKKNMLGFFTEGKKASQNTIRGYFPFPKRLGAIPKSTILLPPYGSRQSNPSVFYVEKERKGGFFKELLLVRSQLRDKISNAPVLRAPSRTALPYCAQAQKRRRGAETRLETSNLQKARNLLFLTSFSNSQPLFIKGEKPFALFGAQTQGRGSLQKRKEKVLLFLNKCVHSMHSMHSMCNVHSMRSCLNPSIRFLEGTQLLPYIGLGSHRFSTLKERKVLVNQSFDSLLKLQQFKTKNLVAASPLQRGKDSPLAKTDVLTLSFLHLKSEELEQLLFLHETLFFSAPRPVLRSRTGSAEGAHSTGQSNKETQKATKIIDPPACGKMNSNLINSLLLFIICSIQKTDIITLQTKLDKSDKSGKVVTQELEGSDELFSHSHLQHRKGHQEGGHQVPVNSFRGKGAQGGKEEKKESAISLPPYKYMKEGRFYVPFYYIKDLKALLRASSVKQLVYDYLSSATCSLPEGLVSSPVVPLSPTGSSLKKGGSQRDQGSSLAQRAREVASISQLCLGNSLRLRKKKQQGLRSRRMLLKRGSTLLSPSREHIPVKGFRKREVYQHKKESFFQRAILLEQSYPQGDFLITSNTLTETVFLRSVPAQQKDCALPPVLRSRTGSVDGAQRKGKYSNQNSDQNSDLYSNLNSCFWGSTATPGLAQKARGSNSRTPSFYKTGSSFKLMAAPFFSKAGSHRAPSLLKKGGGHRASSLIKRGGKKVVLAASTQPICLVSRKQFNVSPFLINYKNLPCLPSFSRVSFTNETKSNCLGKGVSLTALTQSDGSNYFFPTSLSSSCYAGERSFPEGFLPHVGNKKQNFNFSYLPISNFDCYLYPLLSFNLSSILNFYSTNIIKNKRSRTARFLPSALPVLRSRTGSAEAQTGRRKRITETTNIYNSHPSIGYFSNLLPENPSATPSPPALAPEEKLHKQKTPTGKFFSYAIFNSLINNVFESPCFSFNLVKLMDLSTFKKTKTQKTQFLYNNDLNQNFSSVLFNTDKQRVLRPIPYGRERAVQEQQQGKSSNSLFKNKTNQIPRAREIQAKTNYYSPFKGEIVYTQTIAPKDKLLLNDRVTADPSTLTFFSTQQKEAFSAQHPSEGGLYKRAPGLSKIGEGNLSDTKIDSFSYSCMFLTKKDLISYYFPYSHQKQESTKFSTFTAFTAPLKGSGENGESGKNLPHAVNLEQSSNQKEKAVRFLCTAFKGKLKYPTNQNYEINDTLIKFSLLTPLYNEGEKTEFISKLSTSGPLDKNKGIAPSSPFGGGEQTVIQISKTQAGKPMITGSPFRISNNKSLSLLGDFYAYGDPISQLTSRSLQERDTTQLLHSSEGKENMHTILSPEKLVDGAERNVTPQRAIQVSGQVIHYNKAKITVRRAQPIFISPKGILHKFDGDFIDPKSPVITLSYQRLKTGDIIQGIPKVEQFFEARTTKRGRLFRDSLPSLLKALFKRYESKIPLELAVRQSFYKIQQIIVDGVQRVYKSQGVTISDKHLEVIVKQMTSKVRVIDGAQTGFFPGEVVDLTFIEKINQFLIKKITYEPLVLGITKASLEVDSFLSASSFQQTTRVLSQAAIYRKKDFLKGLKENVILGNLIPAGTGYLVQLDNF